MLHGPRLGCGAAIVRDSRILLIRRLRDPEAGCWGLPGGKVDWLEPVEQAVRREISEELGITLHDIKLLCVVDQIDSAGITHWVSPVYLATEFAGEPQLTEPDKHSGIGWFDLSELPQPLTMATKASLPAIEAKLTGLSLATGDE